MTEVFAHRGAHHNARENTLAAFRAALEIGVDGVELDVRKTADGVLVIHHDPRIDGRVVAHEDAAALPPYVPRLDEAMTLMRGLTVNVEIKNSRDLDEPAYDDTGTFARDVLDYLRGASWTDAAIVSCFDRATCEVIRADDPNVRVAWLVYEGSLREALRAARDLGFNAVNPHFSMITPENMGLAGELGLSINVWTVNKARDIVALGELGVASVITDEPELALDLLRARE
jgi:glycerophosphoryl diester phosphodiesterase